MPSPGDSAHRACAPDRRARTILAGAAADYGRGQGQRFTLRWARLAGTLGQTLKSGRRKKVQKRYTDFSLVDHHPIHSIGRQVDSQEDYFDGKQSA